MAKELKKIILGQLEQRFGDLDGCVLIDYRGLDSEQTQDLRASLRKNGILMNVVQNRLARRIFAERGAPPEFGALLKGPTAVLFGGDGALIASKTIVQWRKKNKDLAAIKGGYFQGRALSSQDVESLANTPDQATLRSSALGMFLGPLVYLATATQGLLSHFAGAVKAHRETLAAAGGGEAAAGAAGEGGEAPPAG
jgi:large subunit ribosomal protein L10